MTETKNTETYNFHKEDDKITYFNHLLLESDRESIVKLSKQEGFDPKNLQIKLEVNGEVLRIADFNDILNDWGNRLTKQVEDKLEYNNSKEAVIEKAKELIQERMGIVYDKLNDIENSLWKLEG